MVKKHKRELRKKPVSERQQMKLKQFEIILTTLCLAVSAAFLMAIIFRIRNTYFKKNRRVPVWEKGVGILNRVGKLAMALSLFFLAPSVIYFIFVITFPSALIRDYAKTVFLIIFGTWALFETFLCYSISEKLIKGSLFKRMSFFGAVIFCMALVVYLFPLIPKSLSYPGETHCVMLELPVRGTWLAKHAGASDITNDHIAHPYAIDILKLGPDGRLHKGREEAVTDFYSYNEPVYAPADGKVAQVVDRLEGNLIGNYVIIDIGNEKYVFFAHLKNGSIAVEEGQFVKSGTLIARVGNSGGASGLLHMHMHVQNKATFERHGTEMVTYPFRFRKMFRKRLLFWKEVANGALLRNDKFTDAKPTIGAA